MKNRDAIQKALDGTDVKPRPFAPDNVAVPPEGKIPCDLCQARECDWKRGKCGCACHTEGKIAPPPQIAKRPSGSHWSVQDHVVAQSAPEPPSQPCDECKNYDGMFHCCQVCGHEFRAGALSGAAKKMRAIECEAFNIRGEDNSQG